MGYELRICYRQSISRMKSIPYFFKSFMSFMVKINDVFRAVISAKTI